MFVFLAGSGGKVELPNAVSCSPSPERTDFLDESGNVVARFHSADVSMYVTKDRAEVLEALEASGDGV